jgi:hypothetical protein
LKLGAFTTPWTNETATRFQGLADYFTAARAMKLLADALTDILKLCCWQILHVVDSHHIAPLSILNFPELNISYETHCGDCRHALWPSRN